MASLAIHLFVAQEYLKNSNNEENNDEFIEGSIAPDFFEDKPKSHWGPVTAKPNLYNFLKDNSNNMNNSYYRGYFLHLFTDYLFYNYLLEIDRVLKIISVDEWKRKLYNDYDAINPKIVSKLTIKIPERAKKYLALFNENKTELFKEQDLFEFLIKLSNINIDEIIKNINENENVDIIGLFE